MDLDDKIIILAGLEGIVIAAYFIITYGVVFSIAIIPMFSIFSFIAYKILTAMKGR